MIDDEYSLDNLTSYSSSNKELTLEIQDASAQNPARFSQYFIIALLLLLCSSSLINYFFYCNGNFYSVHWASAAVLCFQVNIWACKIIFKCRNWLLLWYQKGCAPLGGGMFTCKTTIRRDGLLCTKIGRWIRDGCHSACNIDYAKKHLRW